MRPARAATSRPHKAGRNATGEGSARQGRARVLVVDDDERNLLAIRNVIEDLAEVETAASGDEALRHLLGGEFAVILLDVYMPGLDGYETAAIIRGREQTKRIPIVFLSAVNKEKEHLMRGYAMGAVDYVFKPVEPVVLRSKVAVFVELFEMTQEIQRKAAEQEELLDANLRIEQALRLAEQQKAAIIESLPIILYLEAADAEPRVPQFVGGNFAAVTGFPFDAVTQNPSLWVERLHPDDKDRVLKAVEDRGRTGSMAIEYRWRCANDEYRDFLDQAVLLREGGIPDRYAGTLLDVTDRKELEKELLQARKMDAIGQLTGGIAHDFNNLLAAILGGIDMIERRASLSPDQRKIIGMTRHAAEQGSQLVGRLLAFARRQQLTPSEIDIGQLSASVTELLAHTLGGLVTLEWRSDKKVWDAFADSAQLELALMNLILNARDAMPQGGRIGVIARNAKAAAINPLDLPPGDYVVLAVTDHGSGIPAHMLEQVTEPFFTTKDIGKGTGLGLSMVYGFARQSGGAMEIASRVGQGTTVEIWLPRARKGQRGEARRPAAANPATIDVPPLRILLVDDHDAVRETTAGMLHDMGHVVEAAENGPLMLDMLRAAPGGYDLVVTDYAMPHMSGGDMLEQARKIRPDLPGIIISGYADCEAMGRRPEEVVILTKPFTTEQMRCAICSVVTSPARGVAAAIG